MRKKFVLAGASIAACLVAATAIAQHVEGIDIGALRARAAAQASELQDMANEVQRRVRENQEDAQGSVDAAFQNVRELRPQGGPSQGPINFDELVSGASTNLTDRRGTAPLFMTFVSLSMPEDSLRRAIADTSAAGGVVVFRGFPNNSAKEFVSRLTRVVEERQFANIGIDPRLFRAFNVQAVPTYVAVSSDFTPCDQLRCVTEVPPHDVMVGNVTVEYALTSFSEARGPSARVANVALNNLRQDRQ